MKNLRFLTTNLLLLVVISSFAAYNKTTYYNNANGKYGATLKSALCTILNGECDGTKFSQMAYGSGRLSGVWGAFQDTDCNGTTIIDRYSSITSFTVGDDQAGNYSKEGDVYNREHSFPKSWFGGSTAKGPGTDLHHIFPTDGYVNNKRSAYPFGEVKNASYTSSNSGGWCSKLGTGGYGSNTSYTVFEPADRWKGDFARAYFYMVTCYENSIVNWYNTYSSTEVDEVLNGTKHPAFQTWHIQMLLAWSEADPVDDLEVARNEAVMNKQHNRNPFIDFPGLEQYIWGTYSTSYSAYQTTALNITNYVNPYGGGSSTTPSISVSPTSTSIAVDGTTSLSASVSNASGATITWTTSNSSVASLSATSGSNVTVTGVSAGTATITAKITVSGTQYTATCIVTVTSSGGGTSGGSEDELTATVLALGTSYANVTNKTAASGTVYAANAMSDTDKTYIQMRSNNSNSGIVSTSSVGTISKVTVDWNSGTASGRTLNIYGSNTAYSAATDLYSSSSQGTLLGTIVYGTSTELSVSGSYQYIGIRSNSGALYCNSIGIEWNTGSSSTPVNPTTTFATSSKSLEVGDTYTQTVTTNSDGAVSYSSSDTSVATVNSSTGKVTAIGAGTTIITATTAATSSYNSSTATYTINVTEAAVPSITVSPSTASVETGSTTTLTATTENATGYTISWTTSNSSVATVNNSGVVTGVSAGTATITASITVSGTTYSDACTVSVTSSGGSGSEDVYTKVTSTPSDWSGTYLIVYEGGNLAMNGALTADANSNSITVTISNSQIPVTSATEAAEFTIASMSGGYSIMAKGGKYIGGSSTSNNVTYSTSAILNTLSISDGDVTIKSNTRTLCYRDDAANNQTRFRYYANPDNYNAIQLYKKTSSGGTTTEPEEPTISFETATVNLNEGETYTQTATTNSDGAITYDSSNTSVATVDATTGLVTAIGEGTTEITATVAATDSYNEGSATYTITVTETGYTYFVKVTSAPSDWSGEYLIVYEDGLKAMDGSLTTLDNYGNSISVSIQNQRIPATAENKAATFTIAPYNSGYSLKSKSGRYIGVGSSSNSGVLTTSTTTAYANTMSFSDGDVNIYATYSGGWSTYTYYLHYYDYGTSSRFRYYRNTTGNYKPIALYKRVKVSYQFGDVNMDGNVNLLDVPTLAGYLAGTVSANEIDLTAADLDGSGQISLADLTSLVNLLKGPQQ